MNRNQRRVFEKLMEERCETFTNPENTLSNQFSKVSFQPPYLRKSRPMLLVNRSYARTIDGLLSSLGRIKRRNMYE